MLNVYCGEGGDSVGYDRAGFGLFGVDLPEGLRRLPAPNSDLAIDAECWVWKLKPDGWRRLDYVLSEGSPWLEQVGL